MTLTEHVFLRLVFERFANNRNCRGCLRVALAADKVPRALSGSVFKVLGREGITVDIEARRWLGTNVRGASHVQHQDRANQPSDVLTKGSAV